MLKMYTKQFVIILYLFYPATCWYAKRESIKNGEKVTKFQEGGRRCIQKHNSQGEHVMGDTCDHPDGSVHVLATIYQLP